MLFPITAQVRRNSDTRSRNRLRRINSASCTIVLGELRKRSSNNEQEGDGYPLPLPSVNRNGALFQYLSHISRRAANI